MSHSAWNRIALAAVLGVATSVSPAYQRPAISDESALALFKQVVPPEKELTYKQIPWRLTVLEAIVEAQLTNKPILLWQKRGQPLGFV